MHANEPRMILDMVLDLFNFFDNGRADDYAPPYRSLCKNQQIVYY